MWKDAVLIYLYLDICVEGLHKSTVYLSRCSRFQSRDQNAPSVSWRKITDVRHT